jgi:hypothetical protein
MQKEKERSLRLVDVSRLKRRFAPFNNLNLIKVKGSLWRTFNGLKAKGT